MEFSVAGYNAVSVYLSIYHTGIPALSGIRTHDPNVRAGEERAATAVGITTCSPLKVIRRFRGTCHHHLQDSRALLHTSFALLSCFDYSSTLKMEAKCPSGTSVDFEWTARRYVPEERPLHIHRCEILKSYG
jgi:hypothetical protein